MVTDYLKRNTDNFILGAILLIALLLRMFRLHELPFMHDEFSALFRADFRTFGEMIEKGVYTDTHPPLIQIFVFYWLKITGYSYFWIKIPFVIAGVFAVYLAYRISDDWFGKTSATVIATLMATLQYPVFYSQIERPYISGLFLVLLFAYFWNKIVFRQKGKNIYYLVCFVVTGTLCAYNHHFSFLQALVIGSTGLFFVRKKQLIYYCLSGIAIVLLYLFNINILSAQIEMKGIGDWLAVPGNDFIIRYLWYVVMFSPLIVIMLVLVFSLGQFVKPFKRNERLKFIVLSASLFIIPFITGFLYSKYINAIIQYSVLIFAFPFLLFSVFGFIRSDNVVFRITSFLVISLVTVYSLVYERKHFAIFYNSPYKEIMKEARAAALDENLKNPQVVLSMNADDTEKTPGKIFWFYHEQYLKPDNIPFVKADRVTDLKSLQQALTASTDRFIFYGYMAGATPEIYPLINSYYPYLFKTIDYYGGNVSIFSKEPVSGSGDNLFSSSCGFEGEVLHWSGVQQDRLNDTAASEGKFSYIYNPETEWGPAFSIKLQDIANKSNFIDIAVDVLPGAGFTNAFVVSSIDNDTVHTDWRSTAFNLFNISVGEWSVVTHSVKLPDTDFDFKNHTLNIYIWNAEKQSFLIDNFRVNIRKGNPILYWIVEE